MRWWFKLILLLIALILVISGGSYYYLFHMHGLEDIVASQLSSALSKHLPLQISVGEIKGDFVTSLELEDVSIRLADSIGGGELLLAKRISTAYKLSNIINKAYLFQYLWLDSAHLVLTVDSAGKLTLAQLRHEPSQASGDSAVPEIEFDKVLLNHCSVTIIRPSDTLKFFDINWDGALTFEDGTLAVDVRQARFSSNQESIQVPSLAGKMTYGAGHLAVQDLTLMLNSGRLKASGLYDVVSSKGQFSFNADDTDVKEIAGLFGIHWTGTIDAYGKIQIAPEEISGHVALGGRFLMADLENLTVNFRFRDNHLYLDSLYGIALGTCALEGRAVFNLGVKPEQYTASLDLTNFNLKNMVSQAPVSDLTGHIELRGSSFKNDSLKLSIDADLSESSFDNYPIQIGTGRMEITTKSISFPDTFQISYFENDFSISGSIQYSGDINLAIQAELANLDRYRGKLFLDQPGGRAYGEATLTGLTRDPNLDGFLASDSIWLYGLYGDSCDATFHIQRFLTGRQGTVVARFTDGGLWNFPYDTGFTVLGLDSDIVRIDTMLVIGPQARLVSSGELHSMVYPKQLTIDSFAVSVLEQTLYNRGEIAVAIDSVGFDFLKGAVVSGQTMLMALGRLDFDESMHLAISANNIPVNNWLRLFRDDIPTDGRASLRTDLTGSFHNPVFNLHASVDSLTYDSLVLGDLQIDGRYGEQVFTLDSLVLESYPGHYFAQGMLNVDIDLTSDSLIIPLDQPIDISITATDSRFDLVTLLLPNVEELKGEFGADFRLFGTPNSPHLEGSAFIRNAQLKYFDLAATIFADSAGVRMKDNQIIIDRIDSYVKNPRSALGKSYAYIDGSIAVKSLSMMNYDVNIDIPKGFPIKYDLDDIDGIVEGSLQIEGETPPTVYGDLTVTSARYLVNFANVNEGSPLMLLLSGDKSWNINLNVDILSNYWIKNDDIDAEFSGFLNVIRNRGEYRFIGEMEVLRGRGFLFDKTFQIEPGSKVMYNNIDTLNPTLDITAYTKIVGLSDYADSTTEQFELGLRITGTLESPEFNPVGDGFSRSDILPLLVANYSAGDTAQASTLTKIEQRMTGLVSSQVSQIGTKRLSKLGVETFEIDPSYGGKLDPLKSKVTLGFYTVSNLYVYGRSQLSKEVGQELGFEYRFNKSFMLEGLKDEEDLYHLNLKLKWEF